MIVLGAVGVVALLAFVVFPGVRKKAMVLINGFLNLFVEDLAKTPEGARAVYSDAIEKCQEKYNQAKETFDKMAGELASKRLEVENLNRQIKEVEHTCDQLVQAGRLEEATIYSQRRSELMGKLNVIHSALQMLEPRVREAQGVHAHYEKKLRDLKQEANLEVEKIRLNSSMKDLLSDLDELKRDTATDKMLGAVRDGSKDLEKQVLGGMVVHQNKTSTKIAHAERVAQEVAADDYIASLQAKYAKKPALGSGGKAIEIPTTTVKQKTPTKR